MKPLKTFIIYSREDQHYKKQFLKHLRPLSGMLEIWHDGNIMPGEEWESEIKKNLKSSDLVIVLVSVNSLNSDFIQTNEITTALELFKQGQTRIVPVVVSHCVWKFHPVFRGLQGLPTNMKPVDSWANTDEAWTDIVNQLADMVEAFWKKVEDEQQSKRTIGESEKTPSVETEKAPATSSVPEKPLPKYPASTGSATRKIELVIAALSHSVTQSHNYAVVLAEKGTNWKLPIVIGSFEAQAIAVALENMIPNRPLTHDLMKTVIETLGGTLKEVIINNLLEGLFYTRLVLIKNGELYEVDCRTSDGVAMAVRFSVPIYTYSFIMEAASVMMEDDAVNK